ncbi:MAG: uroporphyrinogen decarboxylase family protein [Victivallales bacterium]
MATLRENLLGSLRRQGFDKVPIDPNCFCPDQLEAFKKRFGHGDFHKWFGSSCRGFGISEEQKFTDWKRYYRHEELPPDTTFGSTGVGHSHQPGCFHMTRMHHPLKGEDRTVEEIRNYPLPKFRATALEEAKKKIDDLRKEGLASMAGMACTIWEGSWYMRSMEDLMIDMLSEDERAVVLFDRVTELSCERIRIAAKAGADLVQLGDDIGMQFTPMMSVELWRQWLKPRLAKVISEARNIKPDILVFYHSCGFVLPFLEDLIEVGVDILNPVQPECMKFEDVHKLVGGRMSFWSTIGTQTTLPFGKPDEVKELVWKNLRICGKQGGIVIGPTHMVEPEVPWENLVAMKEACEEYK